MIWKALYRINAKQGCITMTILLDSKTTNFIYSINYHFIPIRARITVYDLQNGRKNLRTLFKPRIVFNIRYFQPFFELNTIHEYGGIQLVIQLSVEAESTNY